jgi:hypothetical protein
LKDLVGSQADTLIKGIGSLAEEQKIGSEKRDKMDAMAEATWGVVNYIETTLKDVKDGQFALLKIIEALGVADQAKSMMLESLQSKMGGIDRIVGEFRAEVVSRFQATETRGEELSRKQNQQIQVVGEYRKEVGALRSMLEELERRRVESERKVDERERKREVEEVRRVRVVEEAREAAVRSEKAVETFLGDVRMRDVERERESASREREVEARVKVVSEVAVQAGPVDVEMGDAQAEEMQRRVVAASKAKKVLDVIQHMADLPGFNYNDDDDIASSDDGVVAVRTRGVSAKGKEREVAVIPAPKQTQVVTAPTEHSESALLGLMLDEFRLIKDKLTASERRAREETASTKLLHRAELDTLRSELDRSVESERRQRELETRLERERLTREKEKGERIEREKLERLERLEKGERERIERERVAAERLERERAEMFERAERERKEMLERVERIERDRAEWGRERQRERIEWEREKMEWEKERERDRRASGVWGEDSGPPSASHGQPPDTDTEVAELRRRLALYESPGPVPPPLQRESSSVSISAPPHRETSEPFYPPLPPRRDRSSSIASSSNNVEAAKRPTINTNVAMEVDDAVSLHVPAKAQRKLMRTHHGNMPPPSGEP